MNHGDSVFAPGSLWKKVTQTTAAALTCGAQKPIETNEIVVEDSGAQFIVRQVSSLTRKENHKKTVNIDTGEKYANKQAFKQATIKKPNPFLPYEQALYVCDISATHVCLLNKFNVIDNHVLLVTKSFEHQETLLTEADFAALYVCMQEYNSLGFYNGGVIAGASQEHKHLQLIPLPITAQLTNQGDFSLGEEFPLSPLFTIASTACNQVTQVQLPFSHAVIQLDDLRAQTIGFAAGYLLNCYRQLLSFAGIKSVMHGHEYRQSQPYNLLVTKQWMWLVPRCREFFHSISINALGFAGSLFVRDDQQLELVRKTGPMQVLRSVVVSNE